MTPRGLPPPEVPPTLSPAWYARQRALREQLTLRRLLRAETARLDAAYPPAHAEPEAQP